MTAAAVAPCGGGDDESWLGLGWRQGFARVRRGHEAQVRAFIGHGQPRGARSHMHRRRRRCPWDAGGSGLPELASETHKAVTQARCVRTAADGPLRWATAQERLRAWSRLVGQEGLSFKRAWARREVGGRRKRKDFSFYSKGFNPIFQHIFQPKFNLLI